MRERVESLARGRGDNPVALTSMGIGALVAALYHQAELEKARAIIKET